MHSLGRHADNFAAKLGVGPGNISRGCIAHNNADDGWDLFNKIEDGPNASVTIENSVAYENGLPYNKADILKGSIGNGFKLGGEGQPVNHKVSDFIFLNNNMDGFTDNFNTGSLIIRNNIAMNNARYNLFSGTCHYKFPSSILFDNNYSIRDDWGNKIKDFLGDTVNSVNYKLLVSHRPGPVQKDLFFTRDDSGNIIYPDFFSNITHKFN
ncbi:right-handed parallel beta-helix repeat-containing protein [Escherichia coli]|uniref:right-handed parallel beta-helix repeat-containing protein n=1 Tax=Escherichia coli TaxID=562 RepID=UPI00398681AA